MGCNICSAPLSQRCGGMQYFCKLQSFGDMMMSCSICCPPQLCEGGADLAGRRQVQGEQGMLYQGSRVSGGSGLAAFDLVLTWTYLGQGSQTLTRSLRPASSLKLSLCGQTPDTVMTAAVTAIRFFTEQQQLTGQLQEARLTKRAENIHAQCSNKLQKASDAVHRVSASGRSRLCYGHAHTSAYLHAVVHEHHTPSTGCMSGSRI